MRRMFVVVWMHELSVWTAMAAQSFAPSARVMAAALQWCWMMLVYFLVAVEIVEIIGICKPHSKLLCTKLAMSLDTHWMRMWDRHLTTTCSTGRDNRQAQVCVLKAGCHVWCCPDFAAAPRFLWQPWFAKAQAHWSTSDAHTFQWRTVSSSSHSFYIIFLDTVSSYIIINYFMLFAFAHGLNSCTPWSLSLQLSLL